MSARDAAIRRFYPWLGRYRRDVAEPFEALNLRDAFVAGFVAGGAYAMKTLARLAELVPTIELFCDLLAARVGRANERGRSSGNRTGLCTPSRREVSATAV